MNGILFAGVAGVALVAALAFQTHQVDQLKDGLTTARLHDKDQQAIIYNLGRDVADRDQRVLGRATTEAADRGDTDRACATDISSSFQKGVAAGRAIANAQKPTTPAAGQPGPGVLRDYRENWARDAFRPAA